MLKALEQDTRNVKCLEPVAQCNFYNTERSQADFAPSPPFAYEFDCLPDGGFIGTAAPGDGDNNWWVAKLYTFSDGQAQVIFTPPDGRHQIADPHVSPDGRQVAFISGIMSDFGFNGGDVYTMAGRRPI